MTLKEMERNELVSIHIVLTCGEKVPCIIFQSVSQYITYVMKCS